MEVKMEASMKKTHRRRKTLDDKSNDEEIQQHLLEKLTAYGDMLLGEDGSQSEQIKGTGKKVTKRQKTVNNERTTMSIQGEETLNAMKTGVAFDGKSEEVSERRVKKKKKWEEEMELELRGFGRNDGVEKNGMEGKKKKERREPEVIVFEDRARRKKISKDDSTSHNTIVTISTREHMKEMVQEVYHLGLSGFDFEDKEKLEMQRAVKLGAKPPKNQHLPYKEFMELQKQKKEEDLKQREIDRKMGLQVKNKSNDKEDFKSYLLRKKGFWQDPSNNRRFKADGQLGRYKNGVQVLSKRDVFNTLKGKGGSSKRTKNKRRR